MVFIDAVRALFSFSAVFRRVDACLCSGDGDLCSQYDQASVVVHINVLSTARTAGEVQANGDTVWGFKTVGAYKGQLDRTFAQPGETFNITTWDDSVPCGINLVPGKEYLVGLYDSTNGNGGDELQSMALCGMFWEWETVTKDDWVILKKGCHMGANGGSPGGEGIAPRSLASSGYPEFSRNPPPPRDANTSPPGAPRIAGDSSGIVDREGDGKGGGGRGGGRKGGGDSGHGGNGSLHGHRRGHRGPVAVAAAKVTGPPILSSAQEVVDPVTAAAQDPPTTAMPPPSPRTAPSPARSPTEVLPAKMAAAVSAALTLNTATMVAAAVIAAAVLTVAAVVTVEVDAPHPCPPSGGGGKGGGNGERSSGGDHRGCGGRGDGGTPPGPDRLNHHHDGGGFDDITRPVGKRCRRSGVAGEGDRVTIERVYYCIDECPQDCPDQGRCWAGECLHGSCSPSLPVYDSRC